jgi:hypothetical protein
MDIDMTLHSGKIHTVHGNNPLATAVLNFN